MRDVYFSTRDRAVNFPDFIPSCSSEIVISSSSNGFTSGAAENGSAGSAPGVTTRPALRAGHSAAPPPVVRAACRNLRREGAELDERIVSRYWIEFDLQRRPFKHESQYKFTSKLFLNARPRF